MQCALFASLILTRFTNTSNTCHLQTYWPLPSSSCHNELIFMMLFSCCQVLLHAGDFTSLGKPEEISSFSEWLGTLPYKHKVVIAGNSLPSFSVPLFLSVLCSVSILILINKSNASCLYLALRACWSLCQGFWLTMHLCSSLTCQEIMILLLT